MTQNEVLLILLRNAAKKMAHQAASLPSLVENLVKNWEIEASFKPELSDWRTIDHANYSFAINGGPPQTAEYMLEVGTYNAIIAPNQFYSPANSDFASSHKTFKRMMPTFAWEVLEVYSGPPTVAFKWRHWGQMKNDYVGFNEFVFPTHLPFSPLWPVQKPLHYILTKWAKNSKGEKITAKAHQGPIEIEGVTVAQVDEQVRLQRVETWFDPLEMFRQTAPNGIVNKEVRGPSDDHDEESASVAETGDGESTPKGSKERSEAANKEETEKRGIEETDGKGKGDVEDELIKNFSSKSTLEEHEVEESNKTPPQNIELSIDSSETSPTPKDAIAAAPSSEETQQAHEEMSRITATECPYLMNRE